MIDARQSTSADAGEIGQMSGRLAGWLALSGVLVFSLFLGANRPVSWVPMCLGLAALFALQISRDLRDAGAARALGAVRTPALLYAGVIGWSWIQLSTLVPADWTNVTWEAVEAPGRIAIDPPAAVHGALRLTGYAMAFWIAFRAAQNPKRARQFVRAIAVFSAAVAVFALVSAVSGANPITGADHRGPTTGGFVNRNSYALFAAFGLLANICAFTLTQRDGAPALTLRDKVRRGIDALTDRAAAIYLFGMLFSAVALAGTASRAGVLSGFLGVLAFFLVARGEGRRGAGLTLALTMAIILFLTFSSLAGFADRLARLIDQGADLRFTLYPLVWEELWRDPHLGVGLGGFEDFVRGIVTVDLAQYEWIYAHSSYLENMVELGLPAAAALYLALGLIGLRIVTSALRRRTMYAPLAFAVGCFTAGAAHSTVDFSLQMPANAALFAMILGVGLAQSAPTPRR